jgi:hypothetical protein
LQNFRRWKGLDSEKRRSDSATVKGDVGEEAGEEE